MPDIKEVKNGDHILVDKEKVPKRILEASVQAANKMLAEKQEKPRERKPPTEKQLEARAKFSELAKQRAATARAARDAAKVNPDDLDEIPEGKVLIKAVANRKPRERKARLPSAGSRKANSESDIEVVPASAPAPAPAPAPKPRKQPVRVQTETETESEPAPPPRKSKSKPSQKKSARKPRSYYSETSDTEQASESESEDEEVVKSRVRKYAEKTKARLDALRQIESQLKPANKYTSMSIF